MCFCLGLRRCFSLQIDRSRAGEDPLHPASQRSARPAAALDQDVPIPQLGAEQHRRAARHQEVRLDKQDQTRSNMIRYNQTRPDQTTSDHIRSHKIIRSNQIRSNQWICRPIKMNLKLFYHSQKVFSATHTHSRGAAALS